jgi:hypothetical protein
MTGLAAIQPTLRQKCLAALLPGLHGFRIGSDIWIKMQ